LSTLLASSFVIAREGFEAWLIAILAMASVGGNTKQIKVIWSAIICAILATILLGGATGTLLGNHANIERFEALIGVFTGIILLWVAWFCHGASQHVKTLPLHNSWLLGLAVFGILFREGVEVVIFLTGIIVHASDLMMVSLGVSVGMVILVALGMVSSHQIKKIPIKTIFKSSRWIFLALAVYFLYTGIHEIVEYGL
jgi:FTR1 family protein